MRVGYGYDVHPLVKGRKLILGGVEIPFSQGLKGHSDADVVLHALCDAMLGAAAAGDIGIHFPEDDPKFKDISSLVLLERTNEIIRGKGYRIGNIDLTIVAEKPKVAEFIPIMREKIAQTLEVDIGEVSIKATTTEGLGFIGRQEGIAAMAVASVVKDESKTNL
ncbi:MAG: 2-C-methyl-D-erythritol 2,4-cyclodiphosphate synthase [Deltaproteobacteria bacterium]|nr:MAG: 2-C-methyl-D-erythritol 2,4-cyclodiphosphate synthase [Deltaproteobacteria bacterium]